MQIINTIISIILIVCIGKLADFLANKFDWTWINVFLVLMTIAVLIVSLIPKV